MIVKSKKRSKIRKLKIRKDQVEFLKYTLENVIKFDWDLEFAKIDLSLKEDFNLAVAFKVFDKNSVGWINFLDLKEGFHDLGIHASDDQCKQIVKQYDIDVNTKLTFEEFTRIFQPLKQEYRNLLMWEPPKYIDEMPIGHYQ